VREDEEAVLAAVEAELGRTLQDGRPSGAAAIRRSASIPVSGISKLLGRIVAVGLMSVVVFTALAHGAVEPWSAALFQLIVIALILAWGVKVVVDKRLRVKLPPAAAPLAALAAVGLAQSISLTGAVGRASLSMDVEATRQTTTMIVIMLACVLLAANFLGSHKRTRLMTHFLVIFGFSMALFGIVQSLTWNGRFFWLRYTSSATSPFGPFVNHNNFAGYLEMLIPIPLGLIITRAIRMEVRLFYGFAAALMGVGVLASMSRGGMISLAAGLVFFAVLAPVARRVDDDPEEFEYSPNTKHSGYGSEFRSRRLSGVRVGLIVICIVAAIGAGVTWMGSDKVSGPTAGPASAGSAAAGSGQESFYTSRGWIWADTLSMIAAKPISGVGLGAFATAYPMYSTSNGNLGVDRAHNDYLQILAECGILGGALALWFIISMGRAVLRGIASRDRLLAGFALGGGAGGFALLIHSIFDFNLQVPSNALLFLLISGQISLIGAGLIRHERHRIRRASEIEYRDEPGSDGLILQEQLQ